MPNNPLLPADILNYYQWSAQNSINPPQLPAGYVLATHPTTTGILALRLFDAAYISTGIIDPNRLGTGATGAGNLYLADDGTWKAVGGGGGGGDMYKATYDVDNDGTVDSAERIEIIVRNSTGTTLTKGTVVYLSGATGNRPNAVRAQADTEVTSSKTFGIVVADINNNSDGYVACNGTLHDLDTSAFADGTALWLSATTAGAYTSTIPAEPNHTVFIGYVARSHPTQGRLVILIQNGYELNELHGVLISSEANNDLLVYESSSTLWKNKSISTIFGGTPLVSVPTLAQVTTAGNTTTNAITVGGLNLGTNVGVTSSSAFGLNYIEFNALTATQGIAALFKPATGSTGYAYDFEFRKDTTTFAGLLIIGGNASAGSGTANKNIIAVSNEGSRSDWLAFRVATSNSSWSSATDLLSLTHTQNVLIGTTTDAGYKLDVNGTARIKGTGTTNATTAFLVQNSTPANLFSVLDDGSVVFDLITSTSLVTIRRASAPTSRKIEFLPNGGAKFYTFDGEAAPNANGDDGAWFFKGRHRRAANSGIASAFRIEPLFFQDQYNNIQLNSIHIVPNITVTGTATNVTVRGIYYNPTISTLTGAAHRAIETTSGDVIFNGGNVGIGTTTPTAKLQIKGTGDSSVWVTTDDFNTGSNTGSVVRVGTRSSTGNTQGWIDVLNSGVSSYGNLILTGFGGNVLIGTTTDAGYKLDVDGTLRATGIVYADSTINQPTNFGNKLLFMGSGNYSKIALADGTNWSLDYHSGITVGNVGYHRFYTGSTSGWVERMRIDNNGNVGIGTSNPLYKLHVTDSAGDIVYILASTGQSAIIGATGSGTNRMYIGYSPGAENISITSSGVVRLNSITSGNVLIGTTTDAGYKLDVVGGDSRFNGVRVGLGAGGVASNTVVGNGALNANTSGYENTAIGYQSSYSLTGGLSNTAVGYQSLYLSTVGEANTAIGWYALRANTSDYITAVGYQALKSNTFGQSNTAVGANALEANTSGQNNTSVGWFSLQSNTTGSQNTALGSAALNVNSTGISNTAVGYIALEIVSTGSQNTAIGVQAGKSITTASNNTIIGSSALRNSTGSNNTAIGYQAGYYGVANTTGTNNIFIGNLATGVSATESNRTWIGNSSTTSTWLAGNVLIGTTTDAGYKLYVNGVIRSTSDVVAELSLKSNYQAGDEGGEITLNKPATGTVIDTSVTIDIYQNKLRIFESGGLNRGGYFDISGLSNGVGTNFSPTGYTGILNIMGNPPGQQNVHINNGIITSID